MTVLVGYDSEHLVTAQGRLVYTEVLPAVLGIQHIANGTVLQYLHTFPFRVSAQTVLVQRGQRGTVHTIQSAYRLDGKRLGFNLLLLKKPRTLH